MHTLLLGSKLINTTLFDFQIRYLAMPTDQWIKS